MKTKTKILIAAIAILAVIAAGLLYLLRRPAGTVTEGFRFGVVYSRIFAEQMGLDWKETYLTIVEDLKPKYLRLPVYWQDIEQERGKFNFGYYDWMMGIAEKKNVKVILVIGRKTPRWPECHLPSWLDKNNPESQKEPVLRLIENVVERYKDRPNLYAWQVENEPFLPFGDCPLLGGNFLDREIAKVKELDPGHPVVVTDSGELSAWLPAAKRADIFGTTMYRIVHSPRFGYVEYPLPPRFFWLKANIVHLFSPGKPITVSELQAEPWGPKLLYDISVEEMMKTMNFPQFQKNIEYAKQVGFPEIYLWGAEWWYWMKTVQGDARYWDYAKEVINSRD
ncbi:MAG: hypothetical protein FJZ04_01970 [Candidatus Moranbacteria bacterium]|nr:hypothetical protein [Candidatus Moranbacteria bacterium]